MNLGSSSSFCPSPTKVEKRLEKCTRNFFNVYNPNKKPVVWKNNEIIFKVDVLTLLPITGSSNFSLSFTVICKLFERLIFLGYKIPVF